ncbi:MAG: hypothetical protein EPO08_07835 [Rhodospirillaceae bacterium]|nr:MAG: hypothetical protein EPO08_07835 [Rhodospirillaceae bacterium]
MTANESSDAMFINRVWKLGHDEFPTNFPGIDCNAQVAFSKTKKNITLLVLSAYPLKADLVERP